MEVKSFKTLFGKYGEDTKYFIKKLEKISKKIINCKTQINFMKRCRRHNVTPKGFRIRNNARETDWKIDKILHNAEAELMKVHNASLFRKKKALEQLEINLQIQIYSLLENEDFRWITECLNRKAILLQKKEEEKHGNKLQRLSPNDTNIQQKTTVNGNNRNKVDEIPKSPENAKKTDSGGICQDQKVINLSQANLTKIEEELLQRGTNFAIEGEFKLMNKIVEFERLTKDEETHHKMVGFLDNRFCKVTEKRRTTTDKDVICKLKNEKSIKLLKADKGGNLVIMDSNSYDEKLQSIIESKYQELKTDPTNRLVATLRKTLTTTFGWSGKRRDELAPRYPKIPSIYGQPKIHKEGSPLRIIIAQKDACFSKIAKYLVEKLKSIIGNPESYVKNGKDFLEKLQEKYTKISGECTIFKIDVVNMFDNILTNKAIKALSKKLEDVDDIDFEQKVMMTKTQCLDLINLIINNNYFKHQDKYYTQTKGLAMGSPLSPMLANLVMEDMEIRIKETFKNDIDIWHRYLDDTFINWTGDKDGITQFMTHINNMDPDIKFTIELEEHNELSFLDVKINKKEIGYETSIYKKPTASDGLLHFQSYNPMSVKINVAQQKLKRIEEYCSLVNGKINARREFRKLLIKYGYNERAIRKIFQKHKQEKNNGTTNENQNKMVQTSAQPDDTMGTNRESDDTTERQNQRRKEKTIRRFIPLQYEEGVEKYVYQDIITEADREKIGIAWRQRTTALDLYKKPKFPNRNTKQKEVIYVIPCSCGQIYIGETGRPLDVRVKEHIANVKYQRMNSKIVAHLENNTGHNIEWEKVFAIETEPESNTRKIKEGILIEMNKGNCFSEKTTEISKSWNWLIHKHKVKKKYFGTEIFVLQ